jgi:hypothetical protein
LADSGKSVAFSFSFHISCWLRSLPVYSQDLMSRPLLSGAVALCVLVAFGIGGAVGLVPAAIAGAVALAAAAAYLVQASGHRADANATPAAEPPPSEPASSVSSSEADTTTEAEVVSAEPTTGDHAMGTDGQSSENLSNLLPEELAERYYANFLVPIRQSLPGTRASDLGAVPERIQVLIPDTPSSRNALRNTVRANCRSVAVTPDKYARQFGIYFYSPGKAQSGTIVDVPTILHGKTAEGRSDLSAADFYERFAQRLATLVQQEEDEGLDITIHRDVRSFPLNR